MLTKANYSVRIDFADEAQELEKLVFKRVLGHTAVTRTLIIEQ